MSISCHVTDTKKGPKTDIERPQTCSCSMRDAPCAKEEDCDLSTLPLFVPKYHPNSSNSTYLAGYPRNSTATAANAVKQTRKVNPENRSTGAMDSAVSPAWGLSPAGSPPANFAPASQPGRDGTFGAGQSAKTTPFWSACSRHVRPIGARHHRSAVLGRLGVAPVSNPRTTKTPVSRAARADCPDSAPARTPPPSGASGRIRARQSAAPPRPAGPASRARAS